MSESRVETRKDQGVMTITLADEENRNVLSGDLIAQLLSAIDAADADPEVRVIVLTNRGRVFCAGADLKGGSTRREGEPAGVDLFSRFGKSPKPFVGRINGHCVAGGLGIAAAMDISVALDTARMGFTEVRIGVAPAMVSVLCLPKMRSAEASAAFLRGNRFPAPEAVRMGIINSAVPADRIDGEVAEIVADLLLGGPDALAACKALTRQIPRMSVEDAFEWTAQLSAELFAGDEAREGIRAFVEKRPPSWVSSPNP
ncbi:MAG: enoyl-CoA hydratase-related protein [Acidimicrobiaceae bacterium]|nr:enoyl-CoA hydratase-related protein [Acidimicrobiaceae bacterium]